MLKRGGGIVGYLHARRLAIVNAIPSQDWVGLCRDEYTGLCVAEYIVFLKDALAAVEDADAAITTVIDLVAL